MVPATQAPPPGTSPSPALPLPVLVNITKAKEEARAGSTSLGVGVLVGISVGAAAFVGLIAGGTYAALRSGMGDRCRVSKDAVGRKAPGGRPAPSQNRGQASGASGRWSGAGTIWGPLTGHPRHQVGLQASVAKMGDVSGIWVDLSRLGTGHGAVGMGRGV